MPFDHKIVCHGIGEFVRDQAHADGLESFWCMPKRGYHGTHPHTSAKHLKHFVTEFVGRHNVREAGSIERVKPIAGAWSGSACATAT